MLTALQRRTIEAFATYMRDAGCDEFLSSHLARSYATFSTETGAHDICPRDIAYGLRTLGLVTSRRITQRDRRTGVSRKLFLYTLAASDEAAEPAAPTQLAA